MKSLLLEVRLVNKIDSMTTVNNQFKDARKNHVFVLDFILSGQTPAVLLSEKKVKEAQMVIDYIRKGPNPKMAMTDAAQFVRIRNAITNLMIKGWM